jgi:hypothetical protein
MGGLPGECFFGAGKEHFSRALRPSGCAPAFGRVEVRSFVTYPALSGSATQRTRGGVARAGLLSSIPLKRDWVRRWFECVANFMSLHESASQVSAVTVEDDGLIANPRRFFVLSINIFSACGNFLGAPKHHSFSFRVLRGLSERSIKCQPSVRLWKPVLAGPRQSHFLLLFSVTPYYQVKKFSQAAKIFGVPYPRSSAQIRGKFRFVFHQCVSVLLSVFISGKVFACGLAALCLRGEVLPFRRAISSLFRPVFPQSPSRYN